MGARLAITLAAGKREFGTGSTAASRPAITAHEVAHHVQGLLGVHARVAAGNQEDPGGENARSIGVELQADC